MEIWRVSSACLSSFVPPCNCFRSLPRNRTWVSDVPRFARSHCSALKYQSRREVLQAGVAVAGASMFHARAGIGADMPQVPKTELTDDLQISQVSSTLASISSLTLLRWAQYSPSANHSQLPMGINVLQVIKGCWQLSGGHGYGYL